MNNLFGARYLSQDGVALMVIAAFCLGMTVGALIMDWAHDRERARKPRPARVRPPEPPKPAARHRATPVSFPKGSGFAPGPQPKAQPGSSPSAPRIDVRA